MLSRKIYRKIQNWYDHSDSALLIDGARQVGKTTTIREFLKATKDDYVEINLLENSLALESFNASTDVSGLLFKLSALARKPITRKTILFIDEIQEAKDAITPIKFLVSSRKCRFIFSGSLLGIKLQDVASLPVGFLDVLQMYPMDFEEFAGALGVSDDVFSYLRECFSKGEPVDETIHKQTLSLFRTYLVVGGMPKAVSEFAKTNDVNYVNRALNEIDYGYRKDVAKYQKTNKLLIQDIYDLIPSELNHQNKRFILKNLNEKARFYQCESSFAWLKDSGIGLFVYNADNPVYPLLGSKERTLFKLFLCDVGLLTYKLYEGNQAVILNDSASLNYGAIYEAVVAQELSSHGFDLYYNSDKKRGEIDFLIEVEGKIIPIEVKSGKDYRRHSALTKLLSNDAFKIERGIVFYNGNVSLKEKTIYLPLYMAAFLEKRRSEKPQIVQLEIPSLSH